MQDLLSATMFSNVIGERFQVSDGTGPPLSLTLVEVDGGGVVSANAGRKPFSLIFVGPVQPVLPQRIYQFDQDATGPLELFMVPIGADDRGTRYQVVFG